MKGDRKMKKLFKFKFYLEDENGISPSLGVDQTMDLNLEVEENGEVSSAHQTTEIENASQDYASYLVQNEGFRYSEIVGYDVCDDDHNYQICSRSI